MPVSREEKEFVTYVVELMLSIGPVSAKRMFGGHGLFLDGLMFGLVADSILYLKTDTETEKDFIAKGLKVFTYHKKGKEFRMSYYQAPEETLEDADEMHSWAKKAYGTAQKAAANKRTKLNKRTLPR